LKGSGSAAPPRGQSEDRRMKFIVAVIKPFKLEAVREALVEVGVQGLTVSEVRGFGRQKGHTEIYRGAEYEVSLVPKIRIEVATTDGQTAQVVEAIREAGTTDTIGDGKIFVLDILEAMRIRTGETGETAL
jgi:nitrogen regulatory protein P-II 2